MNPRKQKVYDDDVSRPFEVVSTDIQGPLIDSRGGRRYTIAYVDQSADARKRIMYEAKSEAPDKLVSIWDGWKVEDGMVKYTHVILISLSKFYGSSEPRLTIYETQITHGQ